MVVLPYNNDGINVPETEELFQNLDAANMTDHHSLVQAKQSASLHAERPMDPNS
jgi:hypothetical protein